MGYSAENTKSTRRATSSSRVDVLLLAAAAVTAIGLAAVAEVAYAQDISVYLAAAEPTIGETFTKYFNFAFMLGGVFAFGAIVWGAFKYIVAGGNPSGQSDARDQILQAIIGLFLLIGAGLILRTIGIGVYDSSTGTLSFPIESTTVLVAPNPPAEGSPGAECTNLKDMAAKYRVPYPAVVDPDLWKLINCISGKVSGNAAVKTLGSIFTYDRDHVSCNYTRGNTMCDPSNKCSHAAFSCHYGGQTGELGAQAVDFGMQPGTSTVTAAEEQAIRAAAQACNPGAFVIVELPEKNHIHVSLAKCDSD
ncbi:MAG: Type secretion system pilin [Candidatus Parcubacteria bacterium]|jgi:hypothetical protein